MFEIPKDASPQTHLSFVEATAAMGRQADHPLLRELVETGGTPSTDVFTGSLQQSLQERYGLDEIEVGSVILAAAWNLTGSSERLREVMKEIRGDEND